MTPSCKSPNGASKNAQSAVNHGQRAPYDPLFRRGLDEGDVGSAITLGIQIAQCRYYLQTLGPNVGGIFCILGSLGYDESRHSQPEMGHGFWISVDRLLDLRHVQKSMLQATRYPPQMVPSTRTLMLE